MSSSSGNFSLGGRSEEETDLLRRSKKRNKISMDDMDTMMEGGIGSPGVRQTSYKDVALGDKGKNPFGEDDGRSRNGRLCVGR